jgi:hypothetical protein
VYFNDEEAFAVRKLSLATGIITTAAGVLGQYSGLGSIDGVVGFAVSSH